MSSQLTLALAGTIRHDGTGGVTDDLADPAGLTDWLERHRGLLRPYTGELDLAGDRPDESAWRAVVALRRVVRTLLGRAVWPAPPSRADAADLLTAEVALARLNEAAGRLPARPVLTWPADAPPAVGQETGPAELPVRLASALARAAIDFLGGPERELLRACLAPRCVRYFLRDHPRQQWCKPSCGNRARVARHYHRRQADQAVG
jgi:predicted RNA-binding Zn ribbon-like protein